MGSHWWHWTVKSSLCAMAVSNWGVYCQFYLGKTDFSFISVFGICMFIYLRWYFLIYSYLLTILNGLSLATLHSEEFTQCSGSFEWGVHHQFYLGKSENLNFFLVLHVHHHRSFHIYYMKDLTRVTLKKNFLHLSP